MVKTSSSTQDAQALTNYWLIPYLPPHLAAAARGQKPRNLRISGMRALVPACDKGGTTDAQYRVYSLHLNVDWQTLKAKKYSRQVLYQSQVIPRMPAPAWADWAREQAIIPLVYGNTAGIVPERIGVVDVDHFSKDDFIFEHTLDLKWVDLAPGVPLRISKEPTMPFKVENMPQNAGFTSAMLRLEYTLELF